jgi:putative ABC transport system permease protein
MLFKIAFRNLFRNLRRSCTILLTVALGTGSLFLYHGFNFGIMNQYKANTIRSLYGHGQVNVSGYRDQVFEKPWEHWIDNTEGVLEEINADSRVKHIFPRIQFFAMLSNGEINVSGKGQGIDGVEESQFFNQLNIVEGKKLSNEEDGALLGIGLARALKVKIGDRITVLGNTIHGSLNGIDIVVTGIFHTGMKEFDDTVFRVPIKQAQILLDTTKVESVSIGLFKDEDWKSFEDDIKKDYPSLEATSFAVLDKVFYQHAVDFLQAQFEAIRVIILFIVILGIFNTVSTSILERKQEIGNLRANGESSGQVLSLLLTEGAVVGVIGSIIGIILSYLLNFTLLRNGIHMPPSPGITRSFDVFVELQFSYTAICFTLGLLTSLLATLLAGKKVVKVPIAELLRSV